jgi:general stress protein 26
MPERDHAIDRSDDLDKMAQNIIDTNRYLTLGTSEPDHRPRLSPVYFTHVGYQTFYWVSSPTARHSSNIAARPAIAIVIFDSTAEIGRGRAVYIDADASVVADDELPQRCAEAFTDVDPGAIRFKAHELSGDAILRLYRAQATNHEIHIPGRDPVYGAGVDTRRTVRP